MSETYRPNNAIDSVLDQLIQDNPKEFEKALKQYEHTDWFVREAMQITNRKITPMAFSQAMRRKLEAAGALWNE